MPFRFFVATIALAALLMLAAAGTVAHAADAVDVSGDVVPVRLA